jgi:twinkle protein
MQVEEIEINGFQIDQFNQHDLDVGKSQGTCPLCSSSRKPENKKAKCASYDWERGLGTCHNCDSTFQLHTYKRKGRAERDYIKPEIQKVKAVVDKTLEWFNTRGISKDTLDELKVSTGKEYMPQTGKPENTIQFNYYVGGELTNIKYRDARKNFKLYKGAEKVFYNIDSIVGHKDCIIVEGEMDVLALHEAGVSNVISVPNGATLNTNNLDYLDNCIDYFEDKEKIIIAVDSDAAGQALQAELIRRLGAEVCYLATFDDCKDANEYLLKYSAKELLSCICNIASYISSCVIALPLPIMLPTMLSFSDVSSPVPSLKTILRSLLRGALSRSSSNILAVIARKRFSGISNVIKPFGLCVITSANSLNFSNVSLGFKYHKVSKCHFNDL